MSELPKFTKIVAWTWGQNPFVMGGRVWQPMKARVDCDPPIHGGKGIHICLLKGPDGFTKVAEVTTGAVVGDTLEQVMQDIEECDDIEFMNKQIEDHKKKMHGGEEVIPEEFWRRIMAAKK